MNLEEVGNIAAVQFNVQFNIFAADMFLVTAFEFFHG